MSWPPLASLSRERHSERETDAERREEWECEERESVCVDEERDYIMASIGEFI